MLIDWFTVGAQALNFLLLVWLLKRFLYGPILRAIDARERRVATELADADAKKAEAQAERDEFLQKSQAFEAERGALLRQATEQAKIERQRLIEMARTEAGAWSAQRQEALRKDANLLHRALRQRAQHEVFAIARKVLTDLATTSLEVRICEAFVRRLAGLGSEPKAKLSAALAAASGAVLVRSAFELPAEQCVALEEALNAAFSAEIRVRFETSSELVSGIELSVSGQKLAWSIADHLAALEAGVTELLERHVASKPAFAIESERPLLAGAR